MTFEQSLVFLTLFFALAFFIHGRWRYDLVALTALIFLSISGVVPGREAFAGFGHPAVITVAAVLVISRGLMNSGLIDIITGKLFKLGSNLTVQIGALTLVVTLLSAFMNNVGALAIMLPVAMQIARKNGNPPSLFLMPIAFGSLLGGMTTMMGTPPNVIISMARAEYSGEPFMLFDFSPIGVVVALAGFLFISLVGWRLLPNRKGQSLDDVFHIKDYITEVRIKPESLINGIKISELGRFKESEVYILGIIRGETRIVQPSVNEVLQADDLLVVEANSRDLQTFVSSARLELAGDETLEKDVLGSEEMQMAEAVVMSNSPLVGRTALTLDLRRRYGVNLLAVARKGERLQTRLASIRFTTGDVLLLNGPSGNINETIAKLGAIPLAQRELRLGQSNKVFQGGAIFIGAILLAAFGFLPIQIALVAAALAMVFTSLISIRDIYDNINWSVIVLLGAMIPVGQALESTGAAQLLVDQLLGFSGSLPPLAILAIMMVATMMLTDIVNNAAAAVLVAPIAINISTSLGVSADPFLMGVAIAASCAFLTPIGHQSNTLVMGPGGYRFGDYWRMGLPMEILVLVVAIPLIPLVWAF